MNAGPRAQSSPAVERSASAEVEIELKDVRKQFASNGHRGAPPALQAISFRVMRGEFVVVVGPSGCGKSTTLRIVAGLEHEDSGDVILAGKSMRGVAPQDRDLAMVFQGYALYPQMTVREILEFPLKMRKVPRAERARAVDEAAALLQIDRLLERLPGELSGGERQRVAMGRAIVRKPRVFLFDEPLSNLDAALRGDIRLEIGALVRRLGATALYVTHDHVEAMTLADRIAVMHAGKLLQFAPPREIYEAPATAFVATFLGSPRMNLLDAHIDASSIIAPPFRIPRRGGDLPARITGITGVTAITLGVRPEDVHIAETGVPAHVVAVEPLGAETHLVVRAGGGGAAPFVELRVRTHGFDARARGEQVMLRLDEERVHLFDPGNGGARLLR